MTEESPYFSLAQAFVVLVGTVVVWYILKLCFVGGVHKAEAPQKGKTVPITGAMCNRGEKAVELSRTSSLGALRQKNKVRGYLILDTDLLMVWLLELPSVISS